MKDFDAVVVGAGLGGITAATYLAKAGKRVLLVEKHNVPGGYATSFIRGRFEFEIALHELSGYGYENDKGSVWRILQDTGAADRVEMLHIPEFFRSVFPDFTIDVPVGRQNYEDALCSQFPRDAEGIKKFVNTVFEFSRQAMRSMRVGMKAVMESPSEFSVLMEHYGKTLSQVLNPMVSDPGARAVIGQIWGYLGQPPSKVSFLMYAITLVGYIRFGAAHVKGTSQNLSQAFIATMESMGGEAWFNNGAKKILVKDGKVTGVITEDGTEIATRYVVCSANPVTTALQLVGRDNIPGWYLNRMGGWSGGISTFNIYLGLDCDCRDLGLTVHENFVNTGYDLDAQYEQILHPDKIEQNNTILVAYNVVDPSVSPKGTAAVVLTQGVYANPWLKLSPEEYVMAKDKAARSALKLAEMAAPNLTDHIEVMEIATPVTNMRYTGNPGGSIIGFDENFATNMLSLPMRGPLEGLYFANAWVNLGGGFETCISTGAMASRDILRDMERGGWEAGQVQSIKDKLEKQKVQPKELKDIPAEQEKMLAGLHPRRLQLKVKEIINETASARTFRLESKDGKLPWFRAGQYINLFVEIGGVKTSRPYSISSAPGKPYYDITVRRVDGGFVSSYLLDKVKVGDGFESTGPSGYFYYEPLIDSAELVFLAGGSGAAPFMSIIREAAEKKSKLNIHLIYGSRKPDDIIFDKELQQLAGKHKNIKVDYVISEPPAGWKGATGFLDDRVISSLAGDLKGKTVFTCGPALMYELCGAALVKLGVPSRRSKKEAYGPPQDVTREPAWPGGIPASREFVVTEVRSGKKVKAKAGEPLMNSLERAGIVVPAVCRSGECTACRTRLISGKVFAPARVHHRQADKKFGYIHPCMSYPLDDLAIRI